MRKFLATFSALFIIFFGLATVSSAAISWLNSDLDVVCVESGDDFQRIQVTNGTTIINRWYNIDVSVDQNVMLAIALTSQSTGSKVNLGFAKINGVWVVSGIRIVAP